MKKKLTVILPAAGKGTRLSLPYPKEIFQFNKEKALIDNSFDLFNALDRKEVEFVVIINEEKTDVVKYLAKYKARYNISFTYQAPNEPEYTGAIKSARHLFGENNIVLLPDTIIALFEGISLAEEVNKHLEKFDFAFLCKRETDEKVLNTKGCLLVDDEMAVIDYEDKPFENFSRFNAYWCGFAFKKEVFDNCMSFMEQSTLNLKRKGTEIADTKIFKSKAIEVKDYKDLGTWEELGKLLSKNSSI